MQKWKVAVGLTAAVLCSVAWAQVQAKKAVPPKPAESQVQALPEKQTDESTALKEPQFSTAVKNEAVTSLQASDLRIAAIPLTENGIGNVYEPEPSAPDAPRAGDDNTCATAISMACNSTRNIVFTGSLINDTSSTDPNWANFCNCDNQYCYYTFNSVWLKFVPASGQTDAVIDVCNSTAPLPATCMGVYTGNPSNCRTLTQVACNLRAGCPLGVCCGTSSYTGCDTYYNPPTGGDCSGGASKVVLSNLVAGQTYYIRVSILGWTAGGQPICTGTYTVNLQCLTSCVMSCDPNSALHHAENEVAPGSPNNWINNGCSMPNPPGPAFAALRCNEYVCGSSWSDGLVADEDWYRIVLPSTANLDWYVKAQYKASFKIIRPGTGPDPCVGYTVLAQNDPNAFVPCNSDPNAVSAHVKVTNAPAGEYWLYVAPATGAGFQPVAADKIYEARITSTPCNQPTGACCKYDGSGNLIECRDRTYADCVAQGHPTTAWYWGDGTSCSTLPGGGCLTPFPGCNNEDETLCYNGYTDNYNAGCGASQTEPPVVEIQCGQVYCGRSGTYITGTTPENRRDNDWYKINLPWTAPSDPNVYEAKKVSVTVRADFPVQVMFWDILDPANPCVTFDTPVFAYGDPGELLDEISFCKTKIAAPAHLYGDLFVVVRPAYFGAPLEIPCGGHYYIQVNCTDCGVGACCYADGCQESKTYAQCAQGGGQWFGEGTTCAGQCCIAHLGACIEAGEPTCTEAVNDGCNVTPNVFDTVCLANPGSMVWGSTDDVGDTDWYIYNHPGGDIHYCMTSPFPNQPILFRAGTPGLCDGGPPVVTWGISPTRCEEFCLHALNQPAGQYILWAGPRWDQIDPNESFPCPTYYMARVYTGQSGACCLDPNDGGGCVQADSADDCVAQGGTWQGAGTDCGSINCPPCPLTCTANDIDPTCGTPPPDQNDGCWGDPNYAGFPRFDTTHLASPGGSVCGRLSSGDMDWYVYNHPSFPDPNVVALKVSVAAEVPVEVWVFQLPCGDTMYGWPVPPAVANCLPDSSYITGLPAGQYYIYIAVDRNFGGNVPCGRKYQISLAADEIGSCCFSDGHCDIVLESECTDPNGPGTFTPGGSCDPNPCCPEPYCDDFAADEGEANCGLPNDTVNGGCNVTPAIFSTLPGSGSAVCGTTALIDDGQYLRRDTDWYIYDHPGDHLVVFAGAQFEALVFVLGPTTPGNECDPNLGGWYFPVTNCDFVGYYDDTAAAGRYVIVVLPDWVWFIDCANQTKYELIVASGLPGACCFDAECVMTYEDICTLVGGTWDGAASCDPNPCGVVLCPGDTNCDGEITFADIDYFVEALGGQENWTHDPCPWLNADCNGDGDVTFADIDAFVALIGTSCP